MVGTSPRFGKRAGAVLPRSRSLPSLICGRRVFAAPIHTWMRPGSRSATAGAAPLYGTWFIVVPVSIWNSVAPRRSEEHTSELQSRLHLVCRLLLEKKKKKKCKQV